MSFNGSGLFNINSTGQPVSANTLIESANFNALTADLATGLSNCITKDGQQTVTANLPMAGFRHTGVGNAVARTDYSAAGQVQDGKLNWVDGGGTADAITATYSPVITALVDGQLCFVRATAANATTTPTFAPNGLTARTIVKKGGSALAAGDIVADGHELILRYDLTNTRWELLNPGSYSSLGANTFTGLQTWKASADIVAAATVDLTAATGNTSRITGVTPTSAFTMTAGQWHMCIADGAWPLTYHATTNKLNTGGANYTCAAGDRVLLHKDNSNIVQATIFPTSGSIPLSLIDAAGDLIVGTAADTAGRLAMGSALQQLRVNAGATALEWASASTGLPKNYITGLVLANNGTDPTNDIDIAVGAARDSTNAADMVLASALTKQLDVAWAVGTNQGGLDTGTIANNTYHVWLIKRSDTGVVDVLFSLSATAPTMPTNYDYKRRIGSIMRVSAAIVLFYQDGIRFIRKVPAQSVAATSAPTTAVTRTLNVPTGIKYRAIVAAACEYGAYGTGVSYVLITDLSLTDTAASVSAFSFNVGPYLTTEAKAGCGGTVLEVVTDTSAQIRSRQNAGVGASDFFYIITNGWEDYKLLEGE